MNNTNWDTFKCRCSAINKMMADHKDHRPITDKQIERIKQLEAKAGEKPLTQNQELELAELHLKRENTGKILQLSGSCIAYLMEVYAWEVYGMVPVKKEYEEVDQLRKGTKCEEQALTMLCIVDGVLYKTHKDRIENDFLSGIVDAYVGEDIYSAEAVTDIKNAFDMPSFLCKTTSGLENGHEDQLQGYGDITGATDLSISHTLVDNPPEDMYDLYMKMLNRLKKGVIDTSTPSFQLELRKFEEEEWPIFERSMKFSHIPYERRVFKKPVEPMTQERRIQIYDRVKFCREYLWKYDETHRKISRNLVSAL